MTVGIILAAGRGKRMGYLTLKKPKCFLKIKKKTLLEHLIDNFKKNNIKKIYVITGYKKNIFNIKSINKIYNKNWKNTNMFFSLNCANKILMSNEAIVVYGDIYFSQKILKKLIEHKSKNLVIPFYKRWKELWSQRFKNPLEDLESFRLSKNKKKILSIGEKPALMNKIQGQYMGIMKFNPKIWKIIKKFYKKLSLNEKKKISMTEFFSKILKKKFQISTFGVSTYWYEFDSPKDIIKIK